MWNILDIYTIFYVNLNCIEIQTQFKNRLVSGPWSDLYQTRMVDTFLNCIDNSKSRWF